MNLYIDFDPTDRPVATALMQVMRAKGVDYAESADQADAVIVDTPQKALAYLKAGKRWVVQFVIWYGTPATGLTTAPLFKNRFRIFSLLGDEVLPAVREMFTFLAEKAKEEVK